MGGKRTATRTREALFAALVATGLAAAGAAYGHGEKVHEGDAKQEAAPVAQPDQGGHMMMGTQRMTEGSMPNMRMPRMDPVRGRKLFVSKGCVTCHAINGVGGHDATNLDAHTMEPMMNPFEFAAKMWRMAPVMIYAQEEALGAQILFTGDELADIIAFVHNDEAQHGFTEKDLTPEARKMMHHEHGAPGAGPKAHAEELGHTHTMGRGHGGDESSGHGD
jgi:mono/diheme cytochrome c family protein